MSRPLNAFESVRPRGAASAVPAAAPRQPHRGGELRLPGSLSAPPQLLRRPSLAPRRYNGPAVQGRAAAQADNDRRRAIVRGGI